MDTASTFAATSLPDTCWSSPMLMRFCVLQRAAWRRRQPCPAHTSTTCSAPTTTRPRPSSSPSSSSYSCSMWVSSRLFILGTESMVASERLFISMRDQIRTYAGVVRLFCFPEFGLLSAHQKKKTNKQKKTVFPSSSSFIGSVWKTWRQCSDVNFVSLRF